MSRSSTNSPSCCSTDRLRDELAQSLHPQAGAEQPLDHRVVQIAGDPVALLEQREPPLVVLRAGHLERERRLVAEGARGGPVDVVERPLTGDNEQGQRIGAQRDRNDEHCGGAAAEQRERHVGIGAAQRLGAFEGLGDDGVRAVDPPADQPVRRRRPLPP